MNFFTFKLYFITLNAGILYFFQAYQENAPALLTLAHYPDLQEEKGKAKINNMLVSGNMTPQKWVGR